MNRTSLFQILFENQKSSLGYLLTEKKLGGYVSKPFKCFLFWFNRFKNGYKSVEDNPKSGRTFT